MYPMRTMISKTDVAFDAANDLHRADFQKFRETGSWKHSPNRYILEYPFDSIPQMCITKILDFYLG
jgi:hypothetical protein